MNKVKKNCDFLFCFVCLFVCLFYLAVFQLGSITSRYSGNEPGLFPRGAELESMFLLALLFGPSSCQVSVGKKRSNDRKGRRRKNELHCPLPSRCGFTLSLDFAGRVYKMLAQ